MKTSPHIGDRVQGLDDGLEGRVTAVSGQLVCILTREGFELEVPWSDLVKIPEKPSFNVPTGIRHKKEEVPRNKARLSLKKKAKSGPVLEVDLHIEKLVNRFRDLNPYEILDFQLDVAKSQLDFALRKRIQRVVLIHGVGEGVLKAELHTLLRRYDGFSFGDADYATYGMGATEVYIPQELLR
jgi:dsDNA-specific endonuclease/ATPase MutS2